jgi:hypothetical protein
MNVVDAAGVEPAKNCVQGSRLPARPRAHITQLSKYNKSHHRSQGESYSTGLLSPEFPKW